MTIMPGANVEHIKGLCDYITWQKIIFGALLAKSCISLCLLTKLVAHCDGFSWLRWFADTSRIAATDTEQVRLSLSQIKQGEARRLYRDLSVYPLPGIWARDTLTRKCESQNRFKKKGIKKILISHYSPSPHSTWPLQGPSLLGASSSGPHSFWLPLLLAIQGVCQVRRPLEVKWGIVRTPNLR